MTLFIAIGNPLRGDDGVAQEVLARLGQVDSRPALQLTPEMAAEIASYDDVVFIDADVLVRDVRIERLEAAPSEPAAAGVTHVLDPESVVALARRLFGFAGRAYLCHVAAADFSAGEGVSSGALRDAGRAARQLRQMFVR